MQQRWHPNPGCPHGSDLPDVINGDHGNRWQENGRGAGDLPFAFNAICALDNLYRVMLCDKDGDFGDSICGYTFCPPNL